MQTTSPYLRALLRFWWVVVFGVLIAAVVAVLAVYRVDLGVPPTLHARSLPTYSTGARVLVTSPEKPYFRTSVERELTTVAGEEGGEAPVVNTAPDTGTLINAANLYPLLIESDQVAQIRLDRLGHVPGVVTAATVYAINRPGRFEPSRIPVIEIIALSNSPGNAARLAQGTVEAFQRWIRQQQQASDVKPEQRILIEQIQAPRGVIKTGGTSLSMPVLAAFAIMLAFAGLALLLDRVLSGDRPSGGVLESLEQRAAASRR